MREYDFEVYLAGQPPVDDDLADRLFAAGCDDGTPGSCEGVTAVMFTREAESLEGAIRSAIADIAQAGYRAERVMIEVPAMEASHGDG